MKQLALPSVALAVALAAFGTSPAGPASVADADETADAIELACKPRGTSCHTGFECCTQNCQPVNGKDVCK